MQWVFCTDRDRGLLFYSKPLVQSIKLLWKILHTNREEISEIVRFKSTDEAGSDDELGVDKDEAKKKEEAFKPVQEKIKKALGDRVKDTQAAWAAC